MKDTNKIYPFNEGDDYYTIEWNALLTCVEVIKSCWDEVSEELNDTNPSQIYFKTKKEAIDSIKFKYYGYGLQENHELKTNY